jgi:hypothetical protein
MLVFVFCLAWVVVVLSPGSAAGKRLHKLLVEAPARRLPDISRRSLAIASLVMFALVAMTGLIRGDELALWGQGYPEAVMWLTSIDITTSLDLIVVAWLLSAQLRLRAIGRSVKTLADQIVLRSLGKTPARGAFREARRSKRKPVQPANDDAEPWAAVVAA